MQDKTHHHNALPLGFKLHWYVIKDVLGRGGFGITYLANDTNLNRNVAIKEFLPIELCYRDETDSVNPLATDSKYQYEWGLERFITEAQTLAKFEHPNIVRVIAVFEENKTGYMVMKYEEGEELQELQSRKNRIEEDDLLRIIFPLLDGLGKIHAAGFIHRDIKPQNIMIRADGSPVLIDFGSARQALGGKTKTLTSLISPGYAPFEQYYTKGDKQGPWTDIYALAATLYKCVSGINPLSAVDRSEGILHGSGDYFVSATELGRDYYSEDFLTAIDKGLKFNPKDRPQSIAEWVKDFRKVKQPESLFINEDAIPTEIATGRPSDIKDEPGHKFKKYRLPIYIGGLIVTISVITFFLFNQYSSEGVQKQAGNETDPGTIVTDTTGPLKEEGPEDDVIDETRTAVTALLNNAQESLTSGQLTTPPGDNAYFYFREVLKIDPENETALKGIDTVFINLFDQIKSATKAGDYEAARDYLSAADEIRPDSNIVRLAEKDLDLKIAEATREQERIRLEQEEKEKRNQVSQLLEKAESKINNKQLINPRGDNARYFYKQALLIEPDNREAVNGLVNISNEFISSSKKAIAVDDLVLAREYLAIAKETAPAEKNILQSISELELKIKNYADRKKLALQEEAKKAESEKLLMENEVKLQQRKEQEAQQQRLQEEKRRLAEENQRKIEEEQKKQRDELAAEAKRLEAEKIKEQEKQVALQEKQSAIFITINAIDSKYQAKGVIPDNIVNEVTTLLSRSGFKVVNEHGELRSDMNTQMNLVFNAESSPGGRIILWEASASVNYLGQEIWSDKKERKGSVKEVYGQKVYVEGIDDIRPAKDAFLEMVRGFITQYSLHAQNWPPSQ